MYIDNPVGAGFSYIAVGDDDDIPSTAIEAAEDLYSALTKEFFSDSMFGDYHENDFYLFGESYAGWFENCCFY